MENKMFCPKCDKTQPVKTIQRQETFTVRDEKVSVLSEMNVCSVCKEEFATTEQEEENVRKAYDEYRRENGLLTHSEVRDVRVQYGLSQTAFSRWLGWGDVTIHRYESGSLQDAVHNEALPAEQTHWLQIVGLYDILARTDPSAVVELNRAVAIAMRDGAAAGLAIVDGILARGDLDEYQHAHSARADLCRRLGRLEDARASYRRALALTRQEPERRFLERRVDELGPPLSAGGSTASRGD